MILADTSVWVAHFRGTDRAAPLGRLLDVGDVLTHTWVSGELALGNLGRRRTVILKELRTLPQAPVIADSEVMEMVEARALAMSGIGWVDAQLLASALATRASLWSFDRCLDAAAQKCGVAARF